ncbi:S41 family peptidase [Arhodomonas sp. SL1]|uniref:S41 family peptidase n=1 Tax=Arhodomonas sp. SL1 TaxID=3425691 RepID=UPI003F881BB8
MRFSKTLYTLFAGALFGFILATGQQVWAERDEAQAKVPVEELRAFTEVFGRIQRGYVESISDRELIDNAIRGMLSGLDPHSAYLDPEAYEDLQAGTSGEFGGLGIEVGSENGFVKVIAPIDGTPADEAGIQAGDLIIRIDGQPAKDLSLDEAVHLMRGEPGTDITLSIMREDRDQPLEVTITRAVIQVESVKSRMLDRRFGYLRISQFQNATSDDVIAAVEQLRGEADDGLRGLVLDLRNNPGGVLNAAVDVSDLFLTEGEVVSTRGRLDDSEMRFTATPNDLLGGAPMVVLINAGSASASEIVAGALQDHGRAVVMGEKSFGKGSVQTIVPLQDGSAIKLTTARYYTPDGRSIQAEGIAPDVVVRPVQVAEAERNGPRPLSEADLSRHLRGDGEDNGESGDAGVADRLAREDYVLAQALNLLRGLDILGERMAR